MRDMSDFKLLLDKLSFFVRVSFEDFVEFEIEKMLG